MIVFTLLLLAVLWCFAWESTAKDRLREVASNGTVWRAAFIEAHDAELRRLLASIESRAAALAKDKIDAAHQEAAIIQKRFAELLQDDRRLREATRKMLMLVERGGRQMLAYYTPVLVDFLESPIPSPLRITTKQIQMERFTVQVSISLGLSEECISEFVVRHLAEQIEVAILQRWRNQSPLVKGMV